MKFTIVHISDIHIKGNSEENFLKKVEDLISSTIKSNSVSTNAIFIIVSGDIAFSGKEHEYDVAYNFFKHIEDNLKREYSGDIYFLITPGNHDCNFATANQMRTMLLTQLQGRHEPLEKDTIDFISSIQQEYFNFEKRLCPQLNEHSKIYKSWSYTSDETVINFSLINTSWCSELREKQGELIIPCNHISYDDFGQNDFNITIFHHPLNWFNQATYHPFRKLVKQNSTFIITGHEHEHTITDTYNQDTSDCVLIEGASLYSHDGSSQFTIIKIDTAIKEYCSQTYTYDSNVNVYISNLETINKYGNKHNGMSRTLGYRQEIIDENNDLSNFQNSGTEHLNLGDIYVYPHIKEINDGIDKKPCDASELKNISFIEKCIVLQGDEKSGKTALLKKLLEDYLKQGYYPIYIDGKKSKLPSIDSVEQIITTSVKEQYINELSDDIFKQTPKDKKIVLFDNFDDISIKSGQSLYELTNKLKSIFDSTIIVVSELFDLTSFIEEKGINPFNGHRSFLIQPFGFQKRHELIKKWYHVGKSKHDEEAAFLRKIDKAEKNIGIIISKNLIPPAPLYLLTLMQSMEAGHGNELNESSLGEYYSFLITQSLLGNGVRKEQLTEFREYLCQLSWFMHYQGLEQLSLDDLRVFNSDFSTKKHTVELTPRLEKLCAAHILSKSGIMYSFKYPFIYFYFKGQYLSDNIDSEECITHIEHCFKHLYVRTNAHTILFLAHHAGSNSTRALIQCMNNSMSSIFKENTPVTFATDEGLTNIVRYSPDLIFNKIPPEKYRERINKTKDIPGNDHDGLSDKEEDNPDDLSTIAKITTMFKAIEIAGQFLKNQYSKIDREEKRKMLDEVFSAPLRSLDHFYGFIRENPDTLRHEIEKELEKKGIQHDKEKIHAASQKTVSALIQFLSVIFLTKPAQAAHSEPLSEDVHHIIGQKNTVSYKMIRLAQLLDSPSRIPKQEIDAVLKQSKGNIFVKKILQTLIIKRLYMYRTVESDMQWISSALDIRLPQQKEIAYFKNKSYLLPNKK